MENWSDGKKAEGSTPTLQRSNTPFARGRVIWAPSVRTARVEEAANLIEQGKWIWHKEGNPAVSAPVGTRYFRRSFTVAEKATLNPLALS